MRHVITFSIFILFVTALFSTNTSFAKGSAKEKKVKGSIGYINEQQNFSSVNKLQIEQLMREIFALPENFSFSTATILSTRGNKKNRTYYLSISSTDGTVNIKSTLDKAGNGKFVITGEKSCMCSNISYSNELSSVKLDKAGNCACTQNGSKSEKVSTSTTPSYIGSFFARL